MVGGKIGCVIARLGNSPVEERRQSQTIKQYKKSKLLPTEMSQNLTLICALHKYTKTQLVLQACINCVFMFVIKYTPFYWFVFSYIDNIYEEVENVC